MMAGESPARFGRQLEKPDINVSNHVASHVASSARTKINA
jgi:hypothetical protein